ncbi:MAG: SHOCT domain-containing protein [Oscillospiraceae bacterium]|jgi:hypothetical protein|nr:SHOCT domain-containing protein [Oscillospiraceae bacterium]
MKFSIYDQTPPEGYLKKHKMFYKGGIPNCMGREGDCINLFIMNDAFVLRSIFIYSDEKSSFKPITIPFNSVVNCEHVQIIDITNEIHITYACENNTYIIRLRSCKIYDFNNYNYCESIMDYLRTNNFFQKFGRMVQPTQQSTMQESPITQIEKLAELHRQGILTDEEFHTKKAELLARL